MSKYLIFKKLDDRASVKGFDKCILFVVGITALASQRSFAQHGASPEKENAYVEASSSGQSNNKALEARSCGQVGTIDQRIKSCNSQRVLSSGAIVTTVSIEIINGVAEKWIRDESTGNIWSPIPHRLFSWSEAVDYCKELNDHNPPPLGIRSWHLPVEEAIVGNKEKSEILTAFNNPKRLQASAPYENRRRGNDFIFEAFPDMGSRDTLWTSSIAFLDWVSYFQSGSDGGGGILQSASPQDTHFVRCIGR